MQANLNFIFPDRRSKKTKPQRIVVYTPQSTGGFPNGSSTACSIKHVKHGLFIKPDFSLNFSNRINLDNTTFLTVGRHTLSLYVDSPG